MNVKNNMNFSAVENKIRTAIGLYAGTAAEKMEGEAKEKAPWTDRTTNSRNSIQGNFGWQGDKAVIALSGNVDYFVFLELAHGKKYSILVPTIHANVKEVLNGYKKLVE